MSSSTCTWIVLNEVTQLPNYFRPRTLGHDNDWPLWPYQQGSPVNDALCRANCQHCHSLLMWRHTILVTLHTSRDISIFSSGVGPINSRTNGSSSLTITSHFSSSYFICQYNGQSHHVAGNSTESRLVLWLKLKAKMNNVCIETFDMLFVNALQNGIDLLVVACKQ